MYLGKYDRIGEKNTERIKNTIQKMKIDGSTEWVDIEIKLAILDALCDIEWQLEQINGSM